MMQFDTLGHYERYKFRISKIQDGGSRHLEKKREITIYRPQSKQFQRNLARLRSSTLLTVPNVKKFQILKIQDGGGRHLEKLKNRDISATVRAISMKFGTLVYLSPPALVLILL